MRTFAGMAAGVILVAALAGCAGQGQAGGDSAPAPSTTAATKPPTGRPATPGGAETVEGGCGGTELLRGAKPRWTDGAGVGSLQMPYALSDNGDVAAFVFGHPLEAREPEPYSDKILWVVRLPRGGQPLHITGRPSGAEDGPTFEVTQPANSGPGEIYPSEVVAPEPGCWHLTLRWNGHVDSIELSYVAERSATVPPW